MLSLMDEENMPSGMVKEPCLFFSSLFSGDGRDLLMVDRYWTILSDFCVGCSMQRYISNMLHFFSANDNVIAVFSRPVGTAVPKSQCQGLELGMAR